MIERRTWEEFRKTGLFWFMNTILHAFGWAIIMKIEDGKIVDSYPARTKFRGFDEASNTAGYVNISRYMKENADELLKEAVNEDVMKEPLTIEELKEMTGQPVYWPEGNLYGIINCEDAGMYEGIPFFNTVSKESGVRIEWNVIARKMQLYRVI